MCSIRRPDGAVLPVAMRDIGSWPVEDKAPMLELYGEEYFRAMWTAWVDETLAFKDAE